MNKIGFNVLAWSAEMSEALLPVLDRLKKIGYDGAEFLSEVRLKNPSSWWENIVLT